MDDLLREFLAETGEHLDAVDSELVRLERDPGDQDALRNVFRLVHTIKGTCGFLGLPRLEALAHATETLMGGLRGRVSADAGAVALILGAIDRIKTILDGLDRCGIEPAGSDADVIGGILRAAGEAAEREARRCPAREPPPDRGTAPHPAAEPPGRAPTVRVGIDVLDHLMTTVSDLVLTRHRFADAVRRTGSAAAFEAPLQRLSQITAALQDGIVRTRLQPLGSAWARLPRLVRDLSGELGKPIELVVRGAEIELDRQVIEIIRDPLTHLVRNAAAHGIEPAAIRRLAGKPERGTIRLEARHDGGAITIAVSDDGAGLDLAAIRRRAVETGLAGEAEMAQASEAEATELIFRPGFSTAPFVDAVSGRGVGMDVVRTNVALVGGEVDVRTERGQGATFTIRIPLTLSVMPALLVEAAGKRFAVPKAAILDILLARPGPGIVGAGGAPLPRFRDGLLPMVDLAAALGTGPNASEAGPVVVVEACGAPFGIRVAEVLEAEEIVVKPVGTGLRPPAAFSGNTIMADGSVALIVNPEGLLRLAGPDILRAAARQHVGNGEAEPDDTLALLVFRGGKPALKAVPLALVLRMEEVQSARIDWSAGQATLRGRGAAMPIVPFDAAMRIGEARVQPIIVLSDGELEMGLAVTEIVDVVDRTLTIEPAPDRDDLIGTATVRGRTAEIVDLAPYLPRAHPAWSRSQRLAGPRSTALLAEPDPFFRSLLGPLLRAGGHKVRVASGGAEALRILAERRIDVVVADLDPGGRGLALVAAIRRLPQFRRLPVLGLASNLDPAAATAARELGIGRIVAKFDRGGLVAALADPAVPGGLSENAA